MAVRCGGGKKKEGAGPQGPAPYFIMKRNTGNQALKYRIANFSYYV
jgi:hypothetical protein